MVGKCHRYFHIARLLHQMIARLCLILLVLFASCKEKDNSEKSNLFEAGKNLGVVSDQLEEASGLVASITNPGYLWTHNDSGNPAELFLIDEHADVALTIKLKGIKNRDFEDISMGPGPDGKNYIYVGDIGDNLAVFNEKVIYYFEEPKLNGQNKFELTEFDTLVLKLSDGVRDTETLMIDPLSKDLFIISKREDSVRLYQLPFPYTTKDTLTAQKVATLPYYKIVAGDISRDGQEVLLKDYDHIYYWKKTGAETIVDLLKKAPVEIPYDREPQGESIAWSLSGDGFFTLSETVKDKRGKLFYYKRK